MRKKPAQKTTATRSRALAVTQGQPRKLEPSPVYPFAAIVAQEELKLALLLTVIDPHIGGVIIMGHRGTGKSTAVRALADLLPRVKKVKGCVYNCDPSIAAELCDDCRARVASELSLGIESATIPVVDLPLGATEDRVCGTLDIERALSSAIKAFEPGLLARANRGFLYIDEVNLLDDHIVDLLLDAAASGYNIVEREGISIRHPSRFVLVGSGNPEEGELRPQLLDRFGLFTEIKTITDLDQRVEIVERRDRFERDAESFRAEMQPEQTALRQKLARAKRLLPGVELGRDMLRQIAGLCLALHIDGHRGELTLARAGRALCAFEGRKTVAVDDIRRVGVMALRHRLRKSPLDRSDSGFMIQQALDEVFAQAGSGIRVSIAG
ncbi:MAG TPA: magnesium chelatase ATPase subunit I [Blastocatellia bacterium]|nr:magnesium chelatase ATPase subunit I [Blastocatellia bacterium]